MSGVWEGVALRTCLLLAAVCAVCAQECNVQVRLPNWGQLPQFQNCMLNKTWPELVKHEKACMAEPDRRRSGGCTFQFKTGGLGDLLEPEAFHVWVCVRFDPCAEDEYFCYVYDEQNSKFIPWNTNSELRLCEDGACGGGWPAYMQLDRTADAGGFAIVGISSVPINLGSAVHPAGDINGDGIADVLVSSTEVDAGTGAVWVIFGSQGGLDEVSVEDLDGSNGFKIVGEASQDAFGVSVSAAGDFNGDGIDDIVIGARNQGAGDLNAGAAYVLFGQIGAFPASVEASSLGAGSVGGFKVLGPGAGVLLGSTVSGTGDVNNDGLDDLLLGAPGFAENGATGRVYVLFGSGQMAATTDLADFNQTGVGARGFSISSYSSPSALGQDSTGWAGDVDGDGFDDVVVGVEGSELKAVVVYGGPDAELQGTDVDVDMTQFRLVGGSLQGSTGGRAVGGAGDVNGDGYADVVVGAYTAGVSAGETYVVYGNASRVNGTVELQMLEEGDGSAGFVVKGEGAGDRSGYAVGRAGDMNGDGVDDVALTAIFASGGGQGKARGLKRGAGYVVFGKVGARRSRVLLGELDGASGFKAHGVRDDDEVGRAVMGGWDVNGDGRSDLVLGAPLAGAVDGSGEVLVLFAKEARCAGAAVFCLEGESYELGSACCDCRLPSCAQVEGSCSADPQPSGCSALDCRDYCSADDQR